VSKSVTCLPARTCLEPESPKLITLDDMPEATGYMTDCYMPHWATCPHAEQHRKGGHA
jgi:hypothetical protein